jgi:hypothetical protein
MGVTNILTNSTVPTASFTLMFLFKRQKPDPIAIHFNSTEHSVNDYEIVALEKICGNNSYRDTIEKLWMNKNIELCFL